MSLPRSVSLAVRVVIATAWAMCLVISGLWLAVDAPRIVSAPAPICRALALAAISGGLVVFMVVVADRLFPTVGRRITTWLVEMGVSLVFLISCGLACLLVIFGGA